MLAMVWVFKLYQRMLYAGALLGTEPIKPRGRSCRSLKPRTYSTSNE